VEHRCTVAFLQPYGAHCLDSGTDSAGCQLPFLWVLDSGFGLGPACLDSLWVHVSFCWVSATFCLPGYLLDFCLPGCRFCLLCLLPAVFGCLQIFWHLLPGFLLDAKHILDCTGFCVIYRITCVLDFVSFLVSIYFFSGLDSGWVLLLYRF